MYIEIELDGENGKEREPNESSEGLLKYSPQLSHRLGFGERTRRFHGGFDLRKYTHCCVPFIK